MTSITYRDFTGTAAENYQRYFVPTIASSFSAALLDAAALRPGQRVVDVACGTGVIARSAAEQVGSSGKVTGIDIAPEMIEVAGSQPPPRGANVEWRLADATSLPLTDDSVEVALCQLGLMFIEDRPAAVREMHRVVAPGGRIVVNTPGRAHRLFQLMEEGLSEHFSPEIGGFLNVVFCLSEPDQVAVLLKDAGFTDVSATVRDCPIALTPPADFLWQYLLLTPLAPIIESAPEATRAGLQRDVVEGCQPFATDGGMLIDQPMVLATGSA